MCFFLSSLEILDPSSHQNYKNELKIKKNQRFHRNTQSLKILDPSSHQNYSYTIKKKKNKRFHRNKHSLKTLDPSYELTRTLQKMQIKYEEKTVFQ